MASCPISPSCASVAGGPTGNQPFSLVILQSGSLLTGQINLSGWMPRVADVTGTIAANGEMTLEGGATWPEHSCQPAGGWRIVSWKGRYDSRADTIVGEFDYLTQKRVSSCFYDNNLLVRALNATLARGRVSEEPFEGHWQGSYLIRQCVTVGWAGCYPQERGEYPFDLFLTQDGRNVNGTLAWFSGHPPEGIPVTGRVSVDGQRLTLTASASRPSSGGELVWTLTSWSTTRDSIGRMQGTFNHVDEVRWTTGPDRTNVFSTSYESELRSVVLVPWD